jgi:hypothetical protein
VISGFCHNVDEICALLGYYTVYSANSVPTFQDNLQVPSSRVRKSKKMGWIGCPKTLVQNYHSTLHNIPEDHRPFGMPCPKSYPVQVLDNCFTIPS